jgi:hypothetical protein
MELSEDTFRALARSSPWRWRTLHFTYATDRYEVEAWLRRPGQLLVRRPGHPDQRIDERRRGRSVAVLSAVSSSGRGAPPPPEIRLPHQVEPVRRPDGLVAERPFLVEYDDPMYQSYDWVAMLDPVELSHHTVVTDLHEEDRLGRRTWWARLRPVEGYEPRCSCCALLWSYLSDRDEYAGQEGVDWTPPAGTVYPAAYDVALDVETAVLVERSAVGPSSHPVWHRVGLLEVDGELDGLVPPGRRRGTGPA